MERRSFLKMSAALSCAATVTGCSSDANDPITNPETTAPELAKEQINWSSCLVNCGSNCPIKVFSRDGIVTRVESDTEITDSYGQHQIRACARGRSLRQRTYAMDRVKSPMKRVGSERDGRYEAISWDEATTLIATKLKNILAQNGTNGDDLYGNKQIFRSYGSGAYYGFASNNCFTRLFNMMGGHLQYYSNYSWAQQTESSKHTFGTGSTMGTSLNPENLKETDYFLAFAYNPSEIRQSGSGEGYDFLQVRENNPDMKLVIVETRYTDSMLGKEDRWVPIRPGTDAAFAEAIAYELIHSGWVDENSIDFINKYAYGYDKASIEAQIKALQDSGDATKIEYAACMDAEDNYKDYILSTGKFAGGVKRTFEWAEKITGVPAAQIEQVAAELKASSNPYIVIGAGVNRQANGEQNMRSLYMLSVLLGKLGRAGTSNGELPRMTSVGRPAIPTGTNAVKQKVSFYDWLEAIDNGENFTERTHGITGAKDPDEKYGANIRFIFSASDSSLLNQHGNINAHKAIYAAHNGTVEEIANNPDKLMIVSCDCWHTPGANVADIILPDTSWLESNDYTNDSYASGSLGYFIAMSSSIGNLWDCKSMYEIAKMIGDKMGINYSEGKTEEQWLEELYQTVLANEAKAAIPLTPALPATYKEAQAIGLFRKDKQDRHVALADFVADPEKNPLATPTGKIEMYSSILAWREKNWAHNGVAAQYQPSERQDVLGYEISPIPKYVVTWDGYEDADTAAKYPLQMSTYHTKGRAHSSYHNVPWLREATEDALWVNPVTAQGLGVQSGDMVRVYNDRGEIRVPVRVTPRVIPGNVALGQGAWYKADAILKDQNGNPVDIGGATNTLTNNIATPVARANPVLTLRVAVAKV